jgi:glycosyltransferase involved in cell wall biosynthesis
MNGNQLVSIIMPSYNTGEYIKNSIQSVINQTYTNWELIIVDDCSTDNTDEIVTPFLTDNRIRFLKNKKNSGAAISRNYALREAKGKWIAFLDSDDIWLPEKLERQLNYMEENNYSFTYTDYRTQLNGKWLPYRYIAPNKVNKRKLYNYCYFFTSTVIYDRDVVGLIQIGDLKKRNDYALWLRAIEKTDCYRYQECLTYYIKHDNSVSSGNKFRLIKWYYIMYKKELKKNSIIALVLTFNNLVHGVIKRYKYRKVVGTDNLPALN